MFFEVKTATQDTNNNFQFNGIRYDTNYTHLFCLGISPDNIYYLIVEKEALGKDNHKMVSMAKGSNASFKLTKTIENLNSFSKFSDNIEKILFGLRIDNWNYKNEKKQNHFFQRKKCRPATQDSPN